MIIIFIAIGIFFIFGIILFLSGVIPKTTLVEYNQSPQSIGGISSYQLDEDYITRTPYGEIYNFNRSDKQITLYPYQIYFKDRYGELKSHKEMVDFKRLGNATFNISFNIDLGKRAVIYQVKPMLNGNIYTWQQVRQTYPNIDYDIVVHGNGNLNPYKFDFSVTNGAGLGVNIPEGAGLFVERVESYGITLDDVEATDEGWLFFDKVYLDIPSACNGEFSRDNFNLTNLNSTCLDPSVTIGSYANYTLQRGVQTQTEEGPYEFFGMETTSLSGGAGDTTSGIVVGFNLSSIPAGADVHTVELAFMSSMNCEGAPDCTEEEITTAINCSSNPTIEIMNLTDSGGFDNGQDAYDSLANSSCLIGECKGNTMYNAVDNDLWCKIAGAPGSNEWGIISGNPAAGCNSTDWFLLNRNASNYLDDKLATTSATFGVVMDNGWWRDTGIGGGEGSYDMRMRVNYTIPVVYNIPTSILNGNYSSSVTGGDSDWVENVTIDGDEIFIFNKSTTPSSLEVRDINDEVVDLLIRIDDEGSLVFTYNMTGSYLKLGNQSIYIIEDVSFNGVTNNVTFENNFTHLSLNDDTIKLYHTFDTDVVSNTAYEYSENNNDGTALGLNRIQSIYGQAYRFNGTAHIESPEIDPSDQNFSISLWYNSTPSGDRFAFGYGDIFDGSAYDIDIRGGAVRFEIRDGSSHLVQSETDSDYSDGYWHHWVGVVDRFGDNIYQYVDGGLVKTTSISSIVGSLSTNDHDEFNIGRIWYSTAYYYYKNNGYLDEIIYFNRSLSTTEVGNIYNNQSGLFYLQGSVMYNTTIDSGNNRLNVSNSIQNYEETNISLQVWTPEDGWSNLVNLTSGTNYTFNIDEASTEVNLSYVYLSNQYSSYSPVKLADIVIQTWTEEPPVGDVTPPNLTIVTPVNGFNSTLYDLNVNFTISSDTQACWWYDVAGDTNSTITCGNNLTGAWVEGDNGVIVYVNDSANNINSSSVNFTIDNVPPYFDEPVNNFELTTGDNFENDINASDSTTGISAYLINDSVNFDINETGHIKNITDLGEYLVWLNITINDSTNNLNSTLFYINWTTPDTTPPNVSITYPENSTYQNYADFVFNYTVSDAENCYWWNGTGNNSLTCGVNQTINLANNSGYEFILFVNDSVGNHNVSSIEFSLIENVTDTEYPQFSSTSTYLANNSEYSPVSYEINTTITSTNGTAGIEFDGVNYSLDNISDSFYYNFGELQVGSYDYYFWAWGNGTDTLYNNTLMKSYVIVINSSLELGLSSTDPITYGTTTDFSGSGCPTQLSCTLNITNQVYGAGVIWGNYSTAGNVNYTDTSITEDTTINKGTLSGSLTTSAGWTYNYNNTANLINHSETNTGDGDVEYEIFRNNVSKLGGELVNLEVGTYGYLLNSTGGDNYSSIGELDFQTLTINQISPTITSYINNTDNNFTSYNTTATGYDNVYLNLTVEGYCSGTGNITLNGSVINTGVLNISNQTNLLSGYYNVTFEFNGNTNCSGDDIIRWINITETAPVGDIIPPNVSIVSPVEDFNTTDTGINVNYTIEDAESCWWSEDGGGTNTTLTCGDNVTGQTWSEGGNTVHVYVNDSSDNINSSSVSFNIDTTPPVWVTFANQTLTVNTSLSYDIDASDATTEVNCFSVNQTVDFSIDCNGLLENTTALDNLELIWLNISVNDSLNNLAYNLMWVNLTVTSPVPPTTCGTNYTGILIKESTSPYIRLCQALTFK